ncbi:hypothetical protein T4D_3144 [Trichinella pseudospiralis]|uniref:Uncharacterized protein n=1 Tax=Trichinella pseudospiralis TaxID=6337 RepID=A0A0V1G0H1_TRIPS|nr:hypothetical protein T4D_3144 [Trichinella pseudospiralis]
MSAYQINSNAILEKIYVFTEVIVLLAKNILYIDEQLFHQQFMLKMHFICFNSLVIQKNNKAFEINEKCVKLFIAEKYE